MREAEVFFEYHALVEDLEDEGPRDLVVITRAENLPTSCHVALVVDHVGHVVNILLG